MNKETISSYLEIPLSKAEGEDVEKAQRSLTHICDVIRELDAITHAGNGTADTLEDLHVLELQALPSALALLSETGIDETEKDEISYELQDILTTGEDIEPDEDWRAGVHYAISELRAITNPIIRGLAAEDLAGILERLEYTNNDYTSQQAVIMDPNQQTVA